MPIKIAPNHKIAYGWSTGEDYWGGPMNENLVFFDTVIHPVIRSANWSSPPPDSLDGHIHLVASGASGLWAGREGDLAAMVEGAWRFYTPKKGMRAYFEATGSFIWFDGAMWRDEATGGSVTDPDPPEIAREYHVSVSVPYTPEAEELILIMPIVMPIMLLKDAAGSSFTSLSPFEQTGFLPIKRNDLTVGRINMASGMYNGTFEVSSTVVFSPGDRLTIYGPYEKLSGLRNFGMLLRFDVMRGEHQ